MGNHRASHRGSARSAAARTTPSPSGDGGDARGGRRKAAKPARRSAAGSLSPSPASVLPTVIGIASLAAAGAGATALGPAKALEPMALSATVDVSEGTDAIGFTEEDPRTIALSRDSQRQAVADAAKQQLKTVAEKQSRQRNAQLASLSKAAEQRAAEILENKWYLPIGGYRLTARFGMSGGLWSAGHTGLDFAAPSGTPIVAVANGVVTEAGYNGAYGNKTVLTLQDGTEVWFCHQTEIQVEVGDNVVGGEQIGTVGSTGNTTGPHLHLEVRPGAGDPVDPYNALVVHGVNP